MFSRCAATLVAVLVALAPAVAFAGAISVANVGANAGFAVTLTGGTVTSASTGLNAADWADTTGLTAGWNGTIAVYRFSYVSTWSAGASHALSTTAASTYSGAVHDATYKVTVTSDGGTTVVLAYTGTQSGSGTATKGVAFAVGSNGLKITFATGTTYVTTDTYTVRADVLSTTALTLAGPGACVAGTGAINAPSWTNNAAVVTSGTSITFGTPVKILTDATNTGTGAWTCTPKAKLSVDSNTGLAGGYQATAQYTIASGP
ncbi:MAG TPA: hypothetical protein VIO13_02035 [Candidatus Dormibacteraeota bacterium]|jgi:hypothetical protein